MGKPRKHSWYWKTYEQGSDATELTDSLAGYPLEWCTRSFDTAQSQLKSGDFHVYYSENSKGEAVVPRLAIRMEHDNIGEIRGIESNQNIDQFIQPVLDEKLEEFGAEGEAYLKKSEDMKRMTEITEKHRTGQKLDKEDLRFLYEVDGKIEGFGYNNDPRIAQALENRDLKEDYGIIYDLDNDVDIANKFIDTGKSQYVIDNYETFEGFILNSEVANKLIDAGQGNDVVEHLEKFQNLDHVDIANRLIDAGEGLAVALSLDRFQGINAETAFKLIEAGKG
ncbi:MAG: hypothetical protein ACPGTS_02020, partial [Minisyncoccia bacterium]